MSCTGALSVAKTFEKVSEGMDAELAIISGLDQDWAESVAAYNDLSPQERSELAEWIVGHRGDIRNAPNIVLQRVAVMASVAFLETGLRWSQRQS